MSNLSNLKALCSNKLQWDNFCEYLEEQIRAEQKTLEQATEHVKLLNSQGAIRAYRRIQHLRDGILHED